MGKGKRSISSPDSPFSGDLFYRSRVTGDLASWSLRAGESNIRIYSDAVEEDAALTFLLERREEIRAFGGAFPHFLTSLTPVPEPENVDVPPVVRDMLRAGIAAGTGPMAAVAGALAEHVAQFLARKQKNVIVENGGDIFFYSGRPRTCAVYAGRSAFSFSLGISLTPDQFPCAVCTSSGTVGHSLSFGTADAAVVCARSGALADAFTTALGNMIRKPEDLKRGVGAITEKPGVTGALAVLQDQMAVKGHLTLVDLKVRD
jgi:hypothetical protein